MTKHYQMNEFDTSSLAVPEQVSVAMGEIAAYYFATRFREMYDTSPTEWRRTATQQSDERT